MNKYIIAAAAAAAGFGSIRICGRPRHHCRRQLVELSGRALENRRSRHQRSLWKPQVRRTFPLMRSLLLQSSCLTLKA